MKVTDAVAVKGRGIVTVIDALPAELEVGMHVVCVRSRVDGGRTITAWELKSIEMHAHGRAHANGQPAGLLLHGPDPLPEVGEDLEIMRDEAYGRASERLTIVNYLRDLQKKWREDKKTQVQSPSAVALTGFLADLIERVEYK